MSRAASNASPLIHLAAIHRFALLRDFFDEVIIPPAVWCEVVDEGKGRAGAAEVQQAADEGWLRVVAPSDQRLSRLLRRDLDDGEAESICLALEQDPDVVLLDESEARRIVDTYSLNKTGIVGLLIRAKREGKVTSLRDELDCLRDEAGFWIQEHLYERALAAVGESAP